ncbi:hypothetical protein [Cyclobacterium lianum]|uniref:hypothetical protein n=1 Tax=Cyclobacterium lianum TaxID=388280 RepID=UPI0011603C28|nr:hypothetical protein [Cyclobacterium lianum]
MNSNKRYLKNVRSFFSPALLGLVIISCAYFGTERFCSVEGDKVIARVSEIVNRHIPLSVPGNNDPFSREEEKRENSFEKKWEDPFISDSYLLPASAIHQSNWLLLVQLEYNYFNRDQVLLFILHHSWRSFIS